MNIYKEKIPTGFLEPTSLPQSTEEAAFWQEENRSWWQGHPMGYDWSDPNPYPEFTKDFYREIDRRFLAPSLEYAPSERIPFDGLIDYASLKQQDVLEIGVGNGTHAHLLAQHAGSFTGIDITEYAVKSTRERMRLFGLPATILQMDAEHLAFNDNSFDFIWSWGVVHHSANTVQTLREIRRVLRPGGSAVIMVYHRGWWNYYVKGFILAVVRGEIVTPGSLHSIVQRHTDGALARYYRPREWTLMVGDLFTVSRTSVCGPKTDIVLLPRGILKQTVRRFFPEWCNRFLTRNLRMGSFLITRLQKQ